MIRRIEEVIKLKVRPFLNSHGGEVRLLEYKDGVVLVSLSGACAGCPSADLSTRFFIEETLKNEIPEITCVELERTTDPELLDFARKFLNGDL